jgi:hypothetical protein
MPGGSPLVGRQGCQWSSPVSVPCAPILLEVLAEAAIQTVRCAAASRSELGTIPGTKPSSSGLSGELDMKLTHVLGMRRQLGASA